MGVSQGNFSAGPVGLTLVGWALFTGAGVLVKSSGISGVVRNSAGVYTVTFTAARANTNYKMDVSIDTSTTYTGWSYGVGKATANCTISCTDGSIYTDPIHVHVAVYE